MAPNVPAKIAGAGENPAFETFDYGFTWIAHPDEGMQRASHALDTDDGVWLIDPTDAAGLDDRLADLGEVAGVALLLDRHERDAQRFARRYNVPITLPDIVDRDLDVDVEHVDDHLPGTDYRTVVVLDWPGWHGVALHDGETLVVADALGTNDWCTVGDEQLGVHPIARLAPPRHLGELDPDRVLVGHGHPVLEQPTQKLREALATARRRLPRSWLGAIRLSL